MRPRKPRKPAKARKPEGPTGAKKAEERRPVRHVQKKGEPSQTRPEECKPHTRERSTGAWPLRDRRRQNSGSRRIPVAKLKPERYGDKLEVGGKDGGPIQHQVGVSWMTEEQAKARGWV